MQPEINDDVNVEMTAMYDKDTPKKYRFTCQSKDETISVSVYVKKGAALPREISLTLSA